MKATAYEIAAQPFAGSERGSKQQLNLTYSRWLKECKATAPGDIPLIEEQEMIFQARKDKNSPFGREYQSYWQKKEFNGIENKIKQNARLNIVKCTANFMELTAHDIGSPPGPFAGLERGNKQQLNLTHSRWLKACKSTAPGDVPVVEAHENIFKTRRDPYSLFGKAYNKFWTKKKLASENDDIVVDARRTIVKYTAKLMRATTQDISNDRDTIL